MKCIDCIYFLNCKEAEENKKECNKYKTRYMQLVKKEGEIFEFERVD